MEPQDNPESIQRNAQLQAMLRERLAAFEVRSIADATARHAAVAFAVIDEGHGADLAGLPAHAHWSDNAAVLLTRRAATLRAHAGQWALPGGRIDAGETPEAAALRELDEEVGLRIDPAAILGRLDDFATRSGFVITPLVIWGGSAATLRLNPDEVQRVHRIPLSELLRADAPMLETIAESTQPVLRMPVGQRWIAAPTAAVLYQFREVCLLNRATRVAHYEQPVFAWR